MESRIPVVDFAREFPAHWNGSDAVSAHAFNALSLLFPSAEAFFISVVREVAADVQPPMDPELARSVDIFIAQETCHHNVHTWYNGILTAQGYRNDAAALVSALQRQSRRDFGPISRLAIVCAYEHYTAILGAYLLANPEVLEDADPELALVWGWHSVEETQHKAVCFDLYRQAGGGWIRRVGFYLIVTLSFGALFSRACLGLLAHDGLLRPARLPVTLALAARLFLGSRGVAWHLLRRAIGYTRPQFHPSDYNDDRLLQSWLGANGSKLGEGVRSCISTSRAT